LLLPVVELEDLGMVVVVELEDLTKDSTFLFRTPVIRLLLAVGESELKMELRLKPREGTQVLLEQR
jgi:hypothetical protein